MVYMALELTETERVARDLLIRIAQGTIRNTRLPHLIGYKEFWTRLYDTPFGQGCAPKIVHMIDRISAYELSHGRPPLNELVVTIAIREPKQNWKNIQNFFSKEFGVQAPYETHSEAQSACWAFWAERLAQETEGAQPPRGGIEAEEGEPEDRTVKFRKRNAQIVKKRKEIDNYTCQACSFRLRIGANYVIDCHHLYPVSDSIENNKH
jgi:hypothetical protein